MSFKEIFCQDKAIELLQRAFHSDRAAHAYIFAGPEGVGKYKTACEWAALLLCHAPVEVDGFAERCGKCRSCQLFEAGSHPDLALIYKELLEFTEDGKGKGPPVDLPIDVIREFLIAKVSIRPSLSQRKVFVVSEAEKLNISSQNSLLKVLEEPPLYCCIVLLCSRLDKLLPTIKSRSQIIRFGPVDEQRIINNLTQAGLDIQQARYFARLAEGSLGTASQWAELELSVADLYQTKKEIVNILADYEYVKAPDFADEILKKAKEISTAWAELDKNTSKTDIHRRALKTLVRMVISVFQDVMKLNLQPAETAINFDQQDQINRLARRFDPEQSAQKISDCYEKLQWIESSVNERLIFEHLLLSLANSDTMPV
jgi:DNA polymerase-3 subunit delta'